MVIKAEQTQKWEKYRHPIVLKRAFMPFSVPNVEEDLRCGHNFYFLFNIFDKKLNKKHLSMFFV